MTLLYHRLFKIGIAIDCGVYHYSYAKNTDEARNEAEFALSLVKGKKLTYPIAFDIEDPTMQKLGRRVLTDICKTFCDCIEKGGYYATIYTNPNWLKNYLYADELLGRYDLWLAHWGAPQPGYTCGIWQYCDNESVPGISGGVDGNVSFKNYPQIIKEKGLNGFAKSGQSSQETAENSQNSQPEPCAPAPEKPQLTHTVQKGDTLWGIAEKYLKNGARYPEIKALNGLTSDTIYSGSVFKIPQQ